MVDIYKKVSRVAPTDATVVIEGETFHAELIGKAVTQALIEISLRYRLCYGALVADVGCGHGASTILMAMTYPDSEFIGYDYHDDSIKVATEKAAAAAEPHRAFAESHGECEVPAATARTSPRAVSLRGRRSCSFRDG